MTNNTPLHRKIGGIHWFALGRYRLSLCRVRKAAKPRPVLLPALVFAAGTLTAGGCGNSTWTSLPATEAPAPTWAVILTVQNGNEYVVDHGLTLEDCREAIADGSDWPDGACVQEPEREQ